MSAGVRFLLGIGVLHLVGLGMISAGRWRPRSWLDAIPATGVVGWLFVAIEMFLLSAAGVRWSLFALLAVPAAAAAVGLARRRSARGERPDAGGVHWPGALAAGAIVLLCAYAAVTARATAPDYVLFWAAKGERFAAARGIDVAFLRDPTHYLMHPDYPPLLPLLYAWGALFAGRFPWGAALLTFPWFLGMAVAAYAAGVLREAPPRAAALLTTIFAALLALPLISEATAGNADPGLLLFESVALSAVAFGGRSRSAERWAGLALAGAVLVKFEGAVFAGALVLATLLIDRTPGERWATLRRLAVPPALGLGAWFLFCLHGHLLDVYGGSSAGRFTLAYLGRVVAGMLRAASFHCFYLPWAALALVAFSARPRLVSAPLVAGVAFLAANVWFYLHGTGDPSLWIGWSAGRTLVTVLLCGFFAVSRPAGNAQSRLRSQKTA